MERKYHCHYVLHFCFVSYNDEASVNKIDSYVSFLKNVMYLSHLSRVCFT